MAYPKKLLVLFVLLMLLLAGAILYPVVRREIVFRWEKECIKFLYDINRAILKYSSEHDGKLPLSLSQISPQYISEQCLNEQILSFSGQRAAIIYWPQETPVDPEVPLVQIVFEPGGKVSKGKCYILWGNGKLSRGKLSL